MNATMSPPHAPRPAPPLFLVSTAPAEIPLVGAMLGRHPACFGAPELNLLAADSLEELAMVVPSRDKSQFHGLLRAVAHLHAGEQTLDSIAMAGRWVLRRNAHPSWSLFEDLRRRVAPLRLVDPSRAYSTVRGAPQRILASFPDACFVQVIARPVESPPIQPAPPEAPGAEPAAEPRTGAPPETGAASPETPSPAARRMAELRRRRDGAAADLESFLAAAPERQVVKLDVAGLAEDPRATLRALCLGLGLPASPACLEAMLRPEDSPFAGFGPAGANLGNDPVFLELARDRRAAGEAQPA